MIFSLDQFTIRLPVTAVSLAAIAKHQSLICDHIWNQCNRSTMEHEKSTDSMHLSNSCKTINLFPWKTCETQTLISQELNCECKTTRKQKCYCIFIKLKKREWYPGVNFRTGNLNDFPVAYFIFKRKFPFFPDWEIAFIFWKQNQAIL